MPRPSHGAQPLESFCKLVMLAWASQMIATYLAAHIFKISDSSVSLPKWTMHLLKGFAAVISGNTLGLNIIKEVLNQVHFWEVPVLFSVALIIQVC